MFKIPNSFMESTIKDAIDDSTQEHEATALDETAKKLKKVEGIAGKVNTASSGAARAIESRRNTTKSIVAKARGSILQFPVYMSKSVPVAEAHTINKAFERVYASFVQGALSAENSVIEDPTQINNMKFLQKFHTNIKDTDHGSNLKSILMDMFNEHYQPIDNFDEMMTESVHSEVNLGNGIKVVFESGPATDPTIIKECRRLGNEPLAGFRFLTEAAPASKVEKSTSIQSERTSTTTATSDDIRKASNQIDVKEYIKEEEKRHEEEKAIWYSKQPLGTETPQDEVDKWEKDHPPKTSEADLLKYREKVLKEQLKAGKIVRIDDSRDLIWDSASKAYKVITHDRKTSSTKIISTNGPLEHERAADAPVLLRESDVKKANGMLPYSIVATFFVLQKGENGKEGWLREVKLVINVKTIMHLISVNDLGEDLQEIILGKKRSLQKVRYKTGEISYWKDYLLNIKNIKADALNSVSSKRWLNTLKRLGEYDKFKGGMINKAAKGMVQGNTTPIPNATLVLTQSNISYLKDTSGIDLEKISNARSLCNSLFLMALVIVDSTAGSMKVFFPDMDNDWDVQSLASIDAEVSKMNDSRLLAELNRSRLN